MDTLSKVPTYSAHLPAIDYYESLVILPISCDKQHLFCSNQKFSSQNKGFTLVELIVTVAIIAIIVTIATPFILTQLAAMEAKRIRYTLSNTLTVAKAESLIRRKDLILCLSDTNGRCNRNSNEALLLFVDSDGNNHYDVGTDLLLEQQRLSPKYATMHLRVGSRRHYTKFWGDSGKPRGHFGHIKYCPNSTYNTAKYQISFNQVGIVKYKPNNVHLTDCT